MGEPAWSWTFAEKIASSTDAGHAAIELLLSALTDAGWEGRDFFHIQMAVEEAMVNAVTHGNQESPDKQVELEFKVDPKIAYLRIKDQGNGFDPADLPDPRDDENISCTNGRGVMLIQELMTEVSYNARGTEVVMTKHRSSENN